MMRAGSIEIFYAKAGCRIRRRFNTRPMAQNGFDDDRLKAIFIRDGTTPRLAVVSG